MNLRPITVERLSSIATALCIFSPLTAMLYIGRGWLGLAYLGISIIGIYVTALAFFYSPDSAIIISIVLPFVFINICTAFMVTRMLRETQNLVLNRWYNKWYSIVVLFIIFVIIYVPFKYICALLLFLDWTGYH